MSQTPTPDELAGAGPQAELAEALEPLRGRRVTLVVTGSLSAAYVPYWVNYVNMLPTRPELRVLMTRTATTMVSPSTVSALLGREVELDAWDPEGSSHPTHVELAMETDVFLVHPCTFSYLGRLAAGLADTPTQLAIACSTKPVVVCPALPPGSLQSHAYARHLEDLDRRGGVTVLPPVPGTSAATGKREGLPAAPFPIALVAVANALGSEDAES